jgi:hypothetical protein
MTTLPYPSGGEADYHAHIAAAVAAAPPAPDEAIALARRTLGRTLREAGQLSSGQATPGQTGS